MTEWIFACLPGNIAIENSKPEDYQAFWAKDQNDDVEDIIENVYERVGCNNWYVATGFMVNTLTMEEKQCRFVDVLYQRSINDLPWFTLRHKSLKNS